jgi:hypothetical protein
MMIIFRSLAGAIRRLHPSLQYQARGNPLVSGRSHPQKLRALLETSDPGRHPVFRPKDVYGPGRGDAQLPCVHQQSPYDCENRGAACGPDCLVEMYVSLALLRNNCLRSPNGARRRQFCLEIWLGVYGLDTAKSTKSWRKMPGNSRSRKIIPMLTLWLLALFCREMLLTSCISCLSSVRIQIVGKQKLLKNNGIFYAFSYLQG